MKRILVFLPSLSVSDGVACFFMNYYIDLVQYYDIDLFLLSDKIDNKYKKKLSSNTQIYILDKSNKYNIIYIIWKQLNKLFKKNSYDLVHNNLVDLCAYAVVKTAKRNKIPIIYHAHNPLEKAYNYKKNIRNIFSKIAIKNSDYYFSSSYNTGISNFKKKKFSIVNNIINIEKYKFDMNIRTKMRKKYEIDDKCIVIGTVARIEEQKNPFFLVDVFDEVSKIKKAKLFWIGEGSKKMELVNYINKKNLSNKIYFLGKKEDVENYYSMMDIFLLPSKFEGLGIVFVEAQTNGLITIASNEVPKETNITNLIHYYSLSDSAKTWANNIIEEINKLKDNRLDYYRLCLNSNFGINNNNSLRKLYDLILGSDKNE